MIYEVLIPESVYSELNRTAIYYELKQKKLGFSFVSNWENSMVQLKKNPLLFQKRHKQFRSIKIDRFPYLLIFEVVGSKIFIYSLIQAQRNPKKIFSK